MTSHPIYKPLGPLDPKKTEIRLVKIESWSLPLDTLNDPLPFPPSPLYNISLHLEHKSLHEVPYTALSYVWGPPHNPGSVLANGVRFDIFTNLHAILSQLCDLGLTDQWLWMDAISINQRDNEEKSWQVNMMRDIYAEAETVYHFLGPADDDSDTVINTMAVWGKSAYDFGVLDFVEEDETFQEHLLAARLSETKSELLHLIKGPMTIFVPADSPTKTDDGTTGSKKDNGTATRDEQTLPKPDQANTATEPKIRRGVSHNPSIGVTSSVKHERLLTIPENPLPLALDWTEVSRLQRAEDNDRYNALADFVIDLAFTAQGVEPGSISRSRPPSPRNWGSQKLRLGLSKLTGRAFWNRTWIVQELAVPRSSILVCGDAFVPVDHFQAALVMIEEVMTRAVPRRVAHMAIEGKRRRLFNPWLLQESTGLTIRRGRRQEDKERHGDSSSIDPVHPVLQLSKTFLSMDFSPNLEASDPRDLFYGLLGVIRGVERLDLKADYSKPAKEVFAQATRLMIRHNRNWDRRYKLGYAAKKAPHSSTEKEHGTEREIAIEGLPSGVPNWAHIGSGTSRVLPLEGSIPRGSNRLRPWTQRRQPESPQMNDCPWNVLRMMGSRMDRLVSVMDVHGERPKHEDIHPMSHIYDFFTANGINPVANRVARTCQGGWAHQAPMSEAFFNLNWRIKLAWPFHCEQVTEDERVFLEQYVLPTFPDDIIHVRKVPTEELFRSFAHVVVSESFSRLTDRSLFVTESGRIGVGAWSAKVGDVLVGLYDHDFPVLLRPAEGGQWNFFGDAYVDEFWEDGPALMEEYWGEGGMPEKSSFVGEMFEIV